MPRSPEIKYVKRENRKKARQSEWPWVRSKKHERGKRRELFLFEGSEDAIDLENDGAGGNFEYRAQQRRARREKLHRGRIRGSPWSKNYDPEAGVIFYFNKETEQSVYDRPKNIPSEEDVLVEWEEYYHDDNYRYFYVNRVSSKAIWGIPSDIDADFLKIVAKRRARTLASQRVCDALISAIEDFSVDLSDQALISVAVEEQKETRASKWVKVNQRGTSEEEESGDDEIYFVLRGTIAIVYDRPEELPSSASVAVEWKECWDENTGMFYYVHRLNPQLVVWNVPKAVNIKSANTLLATSVVADVLDTVLPKIEPIGEDDSDDQSSAHTGEAMEVDNLDDEAPTPTGSLSDSFSWDHVRKAYDKYIAIAEDRYVPTESSITDGLSSIPASSVTSYGDDLNVEVKVDKLPRSKRYSVIDNMLNFWRFGKKAIHLYRLMMQRTKQIIDISKWKKTIMNRKGEVDDKKEDFLRRFGWALQDNQTLRGLYCRGKEHEEELCFDAAGIELVFQEALEFNDTLVFLDLSYNLLESAGTQVLLRSVKINTRLYELDISNCQIPPKAGTAIMKALKENTALGKLILHSNKLKDKGVIQISKAFASNKTLKYLDLDSNEITSKGVKELGQAMRRNRGLEKLSIANNPWVYETEEPFILKKMRDTTQITISEGDEDRSDHELVRSVLACLVGAVGRDDDASLSTAKAEPLLHYYGIALKEGDDNLLLLNHKEDPGTVYDPLEHVPPQIVTLVDIMCDSVARFREKADHEVIAALQYIVEAVVLLNENKTPLEDIPIEEKDIPDLSLDISELVEEEQEREQKLRNKYFSKVDWNALPAVEKMYSKVQADREVAIVVDSVTFTVAWTDTSETEEGIEKLNKTSKQKFPMEERRKRAQLRRDLIQLEKDVVQDAYPFNLELESLRHFEEKTANWGVFECFGVERLHRLEIARDDWRRSKIGPMLACVRDSVSRFHGNIIMKDEEEARMIAEGLPLPPPPEEPGPEEDVLLDKFYNEFLGAYDEEHSRAESTDEFQVEAADDSAPKLLINVILAKGLADADLVGLSDPYVVILVNNEEIGRTRVIDNCLNPVWEEVFEYDMGNDFMSSWVRFEVYDDDLVGEDEFLGQINFRGTNALDRCGKSSKYFTLKGMKGKPTTYVQGRIKLLFQIIGDGGSDRKNHVRVEDFPLPLVAENHLDYLLYGLNQSNLEMLRVEHRGWLPFKRLSGKAANANGESGDDFSKKAKFAGVDEGKKETSITEFNFHREGFSRLEIGIIMKALSFNKAVEQIDLSGNDLINNSVLDMAWLWTVSPSLHFVDMTMCDFDLGPLLHESVEAMSSAIQTLARPTRLKFGKKAIEVQDIYRGTGEPFEVDNRRNNINKVEDLMLGSLIMASESRNVSVLNKIEIEGLSTVDHGKRKLLYHESIFIAERMHYDSSVTFLNLESCLIDQLPYLEVPPSHVLADRLRTNVRLTELNVSNCAIKKSGMFKCLLEDNRVLKVLDVSNNPLGDDAIPLAEGLLTNDMLLTLKMSNCELTTRAMEVMKKALASNESLTTLHMPDNGLTRYAAGALAEGMKENAGLLTLNIKNCNIGSAGAISIAKMLEQNSVLTDINIGCDPMGENGGLIEQHGALAIATMLRKNTTLKALHLPSCGIESFGAVYICQSLQFNTTLKTLDISGPLESHVTFRQPPEPVFHIFGDESDDEEDDLGYMVSMTGNVSDAMAVAQAEAQMRREKRNRLMSQLRGTPGMDGRIGVDGASAVRDMLLINTTLTELDVSRNNIGNMGVKLICEGLETNRGLVGIDMFDENVNEQCGRYFIKALKGRADENTSLRYIVVRGAEIGQEQVSLIQEAANRQFITVWAYDSNARYYIEDRDEDPNKNVREVEEKIQERKEALKGMSAYLMYHEDFPYCCKNCGLMDNFAKVENVVLRGKLQEAVEKGDQDKLDQILKNITVEEHIEENEKKRKEVKDKVEKGIIEAPGKKTNAVNNAL
jgi:Ran GTPase-activating protein (RanGAP) involved in mRNA processing and transport